MMFYTVLYIHIYIYIYIYMAADDQSCIVRNYGETYWENNISFSGLFLLECCAICIVRAGFAQTLEVWAWELQWWCSHDLCFGPALAWSGSGLVRLSWVWGQTLVSWAHLLKTTQLFSLPNFTTLWPDGWTFFPCERFSVYNHNCQHKLQLSQAGLTSIWPKVDGLWACRF